MPRRGARRKKTRTHDLKDDIEKEAPSGPCSFIVKKGRVGKALSELVCDLRQLMSPHTFSNLKDYIQVAGSLGASHLIRVSSNDKNVAHIHLSRAPAGPCFDLRVERFSLISDIRRELQSGGAGLSREDERFPPVAILTGFKNVNDEFATLLAEALKGLIPVIEIDKINVKTCRRVIMFCYSADESQILSIRHYRVSLQRKAVGSSVPREGPMRALMQGSTRKSSKIPTLGNLVSITDLLRGEDKKEDSSCHQTEEEEFQLILPNSSSFKRTTSSLVLSEVGPRIDASLSRILSGVEEGTVLFAKFAPDTVGSTLIKKKAKRVVKEKSPLTRKKRTSAANAEGEEDDFASLMSE